MNNLSVSDANNQQSPFDSIRRFDEHGGEHWTARDLMPLLGYARWQKFQDAISRAIVSCQNSGSDPNNHFTASGNVVKRAQGGGSMQDDYRLSRFACYLVAMNGDPRKSEIASAQAYFAVKTREAEVVLPAKSDRIRELELENQNLAMALEMRRLDNTMLQLHGAPIVLALRGKDDQVVEVERPTIEVIDQNTNVKFKGMTTKQIAEYVSKTTGYKFKSGAEVERALKDAGRDDLIAQTKRSVLQDYIPDEFVKEAIKVLARGNRQMLLGE